MMKVGSSRRRGRRRREEERKDCNLARIYKTFSYADKNDLSS
jgi:hypothetical protein